MEGSICSQGESVKLYFVRPVEGASSPCLLTAYQACERFNPKWVSAEDCLQMTPVKQDVFICDPFEGKAFAHLTSGYKCVVLGPRCILSCLHRSQPIPQGCSAIHNTAMRGLVITTTGFDKDKREELKSLVERMAGIYSAGYHLGVTHLVANGVGSNKYQVGVEHEIPIMKGEWVVAVWQAVTKDHTQHILATDERFLSLTCPALYGMEVCVSQLDLATKTALKGLIEENGGTYNAMLEMSKTSVLIVSAPEGEKYTYACKWRIKCLTPDWIYDSVQRGHALQMEGYEVKKQRLSTPMNSQANITLPPEVSQCSGINVEGMVHRTSSVDETADRTEVVSRERKQTFSKEMNRGVEAVETLALQEVQKAGLCLDGCKIFLSGFSNAHLEKLRRVLNCGGATRFNQLSDAVSHMVIGRPVQEHLDLVKGWGTRPHLVYAHWVTESIKLRRPADEAQFTYLLEEEAVVKEARQPQHSTTSHNTTPATHCNDEVPLEEDEVLQQYLKPGRPNAAPPANSAALTDSQDQQGSKIFLNKVFTVSGYKQVMEEAFTKLVEKKGGRVVPLSHPGRVHYSMITSEGQVHPKAEEVVSHAFLEDCVNSKRLLPVEYYHFPLILLEDTYPLENFCITISTYIKKERLFLENLATLLGARCQDMFAKKPIPEKDVMSSTHLICPLPTGNKYQAAKKWGVPSVTADWLIECARTATKVPEANFMVDHTDRPKLARKKIFKDLLAVVLERKGVEEGGEQPSLSTRSKNQSGSLTPSPDRLQDDTKGDLPQNHTEEAAAPPTTMPAPNTQRLQSSPSNKMKMMDISDFFSSSTTLAGPVDPPNKEFYKKFYDDIEKTMKRYKRKPPLQLQKGGLGFSGTQGSQEASSEDKEQQKEREKITDRPLRGVVACASRKFMDQWEEMSQVMEQLGGDFLHSYGLEVTHFLFQGRTNDLNREFRKAKNDGKVIVSPDWLWVCQETGVKVDEVLFPHTRNPNRSLSVMGGMGSPKSKNRTKRKHLDTEEEGVEEPSQEQVEVENNEENAQKDGTQKEKEKLSKQLEEIGVLAEMSGKRNGSGRGKMKSLEEWHRPTTSRHVDIETQPMSTEEPESQVAAITWEDPMECEARQYLLNQLGRSRDDLMSQNQDQQECTMEEGEEEQEVRQEKDKEEPTSGSNNPVSTLDKSPDNPTFVFVLVGMVEEKRQHYTKLVEEMGSTVSLSPMFNPEVTHLVAESLSRSERTLSAIASGQWVLHDSYLVHSYQAGHFLKEEPYAWGNPAAQHLPPLQPENTRAQLAKAAWRWRCAIKGPRGMANQRPFQHMVALIYTSKDRAGAFARTIKAGGGEVVTVKPPYGNLEEITHCIVEMDKTQEKVDVEAFVATGIPCLKPIYINNYLIMDPLPEEEDHYISQYKNLMLSTSGHNLSGVKRLRRQ